MPAADSEIGATMAVAPALTADHRLLQRPSDAPFWRGAVRSRLS